MILITSTRCILRREIILLMLSLIVCLEMNIFIVRNSTNSMATRTNAIPITKLESNESKYSHNDSDVTIVSLTVKLLDIN